MPTLWNRWTTVNEGSTTPGGHVTAVAIPNEPGHFRLFIADRGGEVFTNRSDGRRGLDGWSPVQGIRTTPGAPVTAHAIPSQPVRFALFLADADLKGEVFTNLGNARDGWVAWRSVQQGSTTPGAPVTGAAISNQPGHFRLFLADKGGEVFTNRSDGQAGLDGWTSVQQGSTTPGGHVTAVAIPNQPDHFALFLANRGGFVHTNNSNGANGVNGWTPVEIQRKTLPGSAITAATISNQPVRFALFMADDKGEVVTSNGSVHDGFVGWESVNEGSTTPGGNVTAVAIPNEPGHFRLFIADRGGEVFTNRSDGRGGLDGWSPVRGIRTTPGAPVTARAVVDQGTRFVLFVSDANGEVHSTTSQ